MARVYKEPPPPRPERITDAEVFFIFLAFAFVVVLVLYLSIVDPVLGSITRSESAIGTVTSVSAASGRFRSQTVQETETSFYVLRGHVNVQKGGSLMLQTRLNGDKYICDPQQDVCVQTASRDFAGAEAAKSAASGPASAAGVAQ